MGGGNNGAGLKEPLLIPSSQDDHGNKKRHHKHHHHKHEQPEEVPPGIKDLEHQPTIYDDARGVGTCHWLQTTSALLALQLGWGLWLFVADFARLGWYPAVGTLVLLAVLTAYSGFLFTRLYVSTPGAVLFGDIGFAAAGNFGRGVVYFIIYSLDATRCVILHLAATQSLRHIFPADAQPPLWQCGAAVLVLSSILVQIRSLAELSWVFMLGTGSQLVAIAIVVYELVSHPDANAHTTTSNITEGNYLPAIVAVMNMIFAFGGQFAFVEIMSSMRQPKQFPRAVLVCTIIMACLYGGLGAVGYWSRGDAILGIVIFSLGDTPQARFSAACILLQAISQYLVNLNVWTHNLLVLLDRSDSSDSAFTSRANSGALPASPGPGARTPERLSSPGLGAAGTAGADAGTSPIKPNGTLVINTTATAPSGDLGLARQASATPSTPARCSSDHCWKRWLAASVFVVAYSYGISMTVPYFTTLVGIVTGATYLMAAYGLPAWFTLRLMPHALSGPETALLYSLIPAAVVVSAAGLYASVLSLISDIDSGGEGGWGSAPGAPHLGTAVLRLVGLSS